MWKALTRKGFWIFWASPRLLSCVFLSALWFPWELDGGEEKGQWEEGGGGWRKPISVCKGVWQQCGTAGLPVHSQGLGLGRLGHLTHCTCSPCPEWISLSLSGMRRHFFQTVVYVYKWSENAEEADAGPPWSQLTAGNSCPTQEAGGRGRNPLSFPGIPCWKSPGSSPPPSPTVLHHPAAPSPAVLQCAWLCPADCDTLHSPCPALQTIWAFWERNAGHFCLNSPAWGCWSWQGISRNGEVFQSLLSLLEHKGLSDMQTLISDTDSEGRLKRVGALAWPSCKRWNVRFKSPVLDEFRSSGMKGMKDSMKQAFSSHFSALISHTLKQVSWGSQLSPPQKAYSSWWPLLPQDRES